MSKKIVFFFPSFASTEATAPLGILAVATPLLRAGYTVQLVDSTITPNYKKRVLSEVQDALCLGISLVTGPMIRETVESGTLNSLSFWEDGTPHYFPNKPWKRGISILLFGVKGKRPCWKSLSTSSRNRPSI